MKMATKFSLSPWDREEARSAQPGGKGEGDLAVVTRTLPALRASLPLPMGEGN